MHKTIPASSLQNGNLLQVGVTTYVLVAKAEEAHDGSIAVTIYDGDGVPRKTPTMSFEPEHKVRLSLADPVV